MGTDAEKKLRNSKRGLRQNSVHPHRVEIQSAPHALRRRFSVISRRRNLSVRHGIIAAALTAVLVSMEYGGGHQTVSTEQTRIFDILMLLSLVACALMLIRLLRSLIRSRTSTSISLLDSDEDDEDADNSRITRINSK